MSEKGHAKNLENLKKERDFAIENSGGGIEMTVSETEISVGVTELFASAPVKMDN